MKLLLYIVLLISRLPMRVLYVFSDVIFVLNYYIIEYRKKVVWNNLKNSFPDKTDTEIKAIHKEFFIIFSDYIVEMIKAFSASSNELRVRVQHINQQVFHDAKAEGKNMILLTGHIFNWEWISPLAEVIPQEHCFPVYRKMQSSFWENEIKKIRNKHGNKALEANEVIRHILKNPNNGNSAYMFVADQSPHISEVHFGLQFLNQKTPVFIGYDKLATRLDLVFVYCEMKRVKRGFYQVNYHKISPENEKFEEFEVVKKFHILLEKTIQKFPSNYLWSHRKWKYAGAIKKM